MVSKQKEKTVPSYINKTLYFLVFTLLFMGCNFYSSIALAGTGKAGAKAPDFTLEDLNGAEVSLQEHQGKIVLVYFWATWCRACRESMPSLRDLWSEFEYEDFVILGISEDRGGIDKVRDYCESKGLTFPILLDFKKKIGKLYSVSALPTAYILDKDGRVMGRIVGARNWSSDASKKIINDLIEENY